MGVSLRGLPGRPGEVMIVCRVCGVRCRAVCRVGLRRVGVVLGGLPGGSLPGRPSPGRRGVGGPLAVPG